MDTAAALGCDRVLLSPPVAADLDFLYSLACEPSTARVWRWRGMIPSPERFRQEFWGGDVVTQYVVRNSEGSSPIGLVSAYGVPTGSGLKIGALACPSAAGNGLVSLGVLCLAAHCFISLPIRKIYVEALSDVVPNFGRLAHTILTHEGTLRRHDYFAGAFQDLELFAFFPEKLAFAIQRIEPLLKFSVPGLDQWKNAVLSVGDAPRKLEVL